MLELAMLTLLVTICTKYVRRFLPRCKHNSIVYIVSYWTLLKLCNCRTLFSKILINSNKSLISSVTWFKNSMLIRGLTHFLMMHLVEVATCLSKPISAENRRGSYYITIIKQMRKCDIQTLRVRKTSKIHVFINLLRF